MFVYLYSFFFSFLWILSFFVFLGYNYVRILSYLNLSIIFLLTLYLVCIYNKNIFWYQILSQFYRMYAIQIMYIVGLDGLSIHFLLLCSLLLILCLLMYWFLKYKINLYCFVLLFSLWLLINIFSSLDLFYFYIYFEGIVMPMFILIVFEVVVVGKSMQHINFLYIHY